MVRIYGASDDLVEIEGSEYEENEIGCYDSDVRIWFADGTIILVQYGKPDFGGVLSIKIEKRGFARQSLQICEDEDADIYSDIFEIDSEIIQHYVL